MSTTIVRTNLLSFLIDTLSIYLVSGISLFFLFLSNNCQVLEHLIHIFLLFFINVKSLLSVRSHFSLRFAIVVIKLCNTPRLLSGSIKGCRSYYITIWSSKLELRIIMLIMVNAIKERHDCTHL
jgi:hypothetical protein